MREIQNKTLEIPKAAIQNLFVNDDQNLPTPYIKEVSRFLLDDATTIIDFDDDADEDADETVLSGGKRKEPMIVATDK